MDDKDMEGFRIAYPEMFSKYLEAIDTLEAERKIRARADEIIMDLLHHCNSEECPDDTCELKVARQYLAEKAGK